MAQRWGLTNGKNVIQTEKDLKRLFPKKSWNKLHLQIIYYGREFCKATNCYGLSCKICTTCYPGRKKPLKTKKLNMEILGIGNAIVDVLCKVDDKFISQNNLAKGNMKLIFDKNEFNKLLSNLKIEKTISGGSVANSIVGLSQLGNKCWFDFGEKYETLKNEDVEYTMILEKNMKQVLKMKMLNIFTLKKRAIKITYWFLLKNFDYT